MERRSFAGARLTAIAVLCASFALLYRNVAQQLVHDWANDGNYSHGFLIPPLAAYLVWERRAKLAASPIRPSGAGMVTLLASLAVLGAGILGAELFLSRVSLVGVLASLVLFIWGWPRLRLLTFPLALLLLMIPIPSIIFNQVAFPLQLLASRFGELALQAVNVPVLREGNVITLANVTLEVVEACSGIRSLVSLFTLALTFGYFIDRRTWVRATLAVSSIPVAVIANGLRVAGTGIAAHYYGAAAAEGFLHEFSGWLLFVIAFAMLLGIQRGVTAVAGPSLPTPQREQLPVML
jgi:exosortase